MTYWLLAATLTLTAFALIVVIASAIVALAAPRIVAAVAGYAPASSAALLLAVRLAPSVAGVVGACGIALPAFLWYEEFDPGETVGPTLAVTAALGAALLLRGAMSLARAWYATRAVVRRWDASSRPLRVPSAPPSARAVQLPEPVVAVAGTVRPRLFVAEQVLELCSASEVEAIVAHEAAHAAAHDNLKRALMRACPDVADPRRVIERAWSAAAEQAADAAVAASRPHLALDLAQALIRVARLTARPPLPLASPLTMPAGLEARVRRLADPPRGERVLPVRSCLVAAAAGVCAVAVAAVLAAPGVHALAELAVRALP